MEKDTTGIQIHFSPTPDCLNNEEYIQFIRRKCFKTKMCSLIESDCTCPNGDCCPFAHTQDEIRPLPNFRKTKLCNNFMEMNWCYAGESCCFAHGEHELRIYSTNLRDQNNSAAKLLAHEIDEKANKIFSALDPIQCLQSLNLDGSLEQIKSVSKALNKKENSDCVMKSEKSSRKKSNPSNDESQLILSTTFINTPTKTRRTRRGKRGGRNKKRNNKSKQKADSKDCLETIEINDDFLFRNSSSKEDNIGNCTVSDAENSNFNNSSPTLSASDTSLRQLTFFDQSTSLHTSNSTMPLDNSNYIHETLEPTTIKKSSYYCLELNNLEETLYSNSYKDCTPYSLYNLSYELVDHSLFKENSPNELSSETSIHAFSNDIHTSERNSIVTSPQAFENTPKQIHLSYTRDPSEKHDTISNMHNQKEQLNQIFDNEIDSLWNSKTSLPDYNSVVTSFSPLFNDDIDYNEMLNYLNLLEEKRLNKNSTREANCKENDAKEKFNYQSSIHDPCKDIYFELTNNSSSLYNSDNKSVNKNFSQDYNTQHLYNSTNYTPKATTNLIDNNYFQANLISNMIIPEKINLNAFYDSSITNDKFSHMAPIANPGNQKKSWNSNPTPILGKPSESSDASTKSNHNDQLSYSEMLEYLEIFKIKQSDNILPGVEFDQINTNSKSKNNIYDPWKDIFFELYHYDPHYPHFRENNTNYINSSLAPTSSANSLNSNKLPFDSFNLSNLVENHYPINNKSDLIDNMVSTEYPPLYNSSGISNKSDNLNFIHKHPSSSQLWNNHSISYSANNSNYNTRFNVLYNDDLNYKETLDYLKILKDKHGENSSHSIILPEIEQTQSNSNLLDTFQDPWKDIFYELTHNYTPFETFEDEIPNINSSSIGAFYNTTPQSKILTYDSIHTPDIAGSEFSMTPNINDKVDFKHNQNGHSFYKVPEIQIDKLDQYNNFITPHQTWDTNYVSEPISTPTVGTLFNPFYNDDFNYKETLDYLEILKSKQLDNNLSLTSNNVHDQTQTNLTDQDPWKDIYYELSKTNSLITDFKEDPQIFNKSNFHTSSGITPLPSRMSNINSNNSSNIIESEYPIQTNLSNLNNSGPPFYESPVIEKHSDQFSFRNDFSTNQVCNTNIIPAAINNSIIQETFDHFYNEDHKFTKILDYIENMKSENLDEICLSSNNLNESELITKESNYTKIAQPPIDELLFKFHLSQQSYSNLGIFYRNPSNSTINEKDIFDIRSTGLCSLCSSDSVSAQDSNAKLNIFDFQLTNMTNSQFIQASHTSQKN